MTCVRGVRATCAPHAPEAQGSLPRGGVTAVRLYALGVPHDRVTVWCATGEGSGSGSPSGTWASRDEDVDLPRSALTARYEFKKCLGKGGFGDVWLP